MRISGLVIILGALLLTACAPTLATRPVSLPHRLVDGQTGAAMDPSELRARIATAQLVVVGEEHPNPHHHGAQRELVELALQLQPSLALGLEMVAVPRQPILDRWLTDGNDAALVAGLDWEHTWGFPFGLYQPMMDAVRKAHRPVYALNALSSLARKISRKGLSALDDAERASLPELVPGPESHRAFFKDAMSGHGHILDEPTLERYYTAQLLWDETMAARAAEIVKAGTPLLVVLAGAGHARRDAVAQRAQRRGVAPTLTVLPVTEKDLPRALADHQSDVLWVIRRR